MPNTFNLFDGKLSAERTENYKSGSKYYFCIVDTFLKLFKEVYKPEDCVVINDRNSAIAIANRACDLPLVAKEALVKKLEVASKEAMRQDWANAWVACEEALLKVYSSL